MRSALKRVRLLLWIMLASSLMGHPGLQARFTAESLFSGLIVPVLKIEIPRESIEALRQHPRRSVAALVWVPGQICSRGKVHLKGTSTFQTISQKPSLTLNFADDFLGLSRIHLNNSLQDATFIQEKLGRELFRSAHIPAPRVGHARVELNGRDLGLYVLKEGFTQEFLGRYFARPDGQIFESDNDLEKLRAAAQEPSLDSRWHKLNQMLDMDEFLSFMAMEVIICHWDGYSLAGNNVRVYRDPATRRWVFLPAGMDQTFGNPEFPLHPDMTGTIARAVMETPQGQAGFDHRLRALAANCARVDPMERAERMRSRLRPFLYGAEYRASMESFNDLLGRIMAREKYLQSKLQQYASLTHENN